MWLAIGALLLAALLGGLFYLTAGVHRFSFIKKIGEEHKAISWLIALAVPVTITAVVWLIISVWAAMIVVIHLFAFWMIADAVSAIISKIRKKKPKRNYAGGFTIVFTAAYLCVGWYFAHTVFRTDYSLETAKNIGGDKLRIALIADSHLSITLDGDKFTAEMEKINAEKPDIILIAGDFVDDSSQRKDMVAAVEALGKMDVKYGVYYAEGNHDRGYMESSRDFTMDEMLDEMRKNNIIVLSDETAMAGDNICVIGRKDRRDGDTIGRKSMDELMADIPKDCYTIVMDHQPNDYDNEAASGADLVVSGHTHGGHLFPAGPIGVLVGANDLCYGQERRKSTDFIVTSGISGWAIPFKTGCISEYVIIDVEKNNVNTNIQ